MKTLYTFVLAVILSTTAYAQKFSDSDIDKALTAAANRLNKTLPMYINRGIRLDTSLPGPGKKLTYIATVMNSDSGALATGAELNVSKLKPGICNDASRQFLLQNGVVFFYIFRNENLAQISRASISASDCGISIYR